MYFTRRKYLRSQATNINFDRFNRMTRLGHSSSEPKANGYRVEGPRVSDAIGLALRDAYEDDLRLPEDMASLLRRLNGGFTRTAR
jgi:hypothetical protein